MAGTGTGTYSQLEDELQKYKDQHASANQLWKKYGEPNGTPFIPWLTNQTMKAKASPWYKEGMSIAQIVQGNIDNPVDASTTNDASRSTSKEFKIMGMNGWGVIIGGAAIVVTGIILYKKLKKSE